LPKKIKTKEDYIARIEELKDQISRYKNGEDVPDFSYPDANRELFKLKRGLPLLKKKDTDDK
jgi:hypothetical protein